MFSKNFIFVYLTNFFDLLILILFSYLKWFLILFMTIYSSLLKIFLINAFHTYLKLLKIFSKLIIHQFLKLVVSQFRKFRIRVHCKLVGIKLWIRYNMFWYVRILLNFWLYYIKWFMSISEVVVKLRSDYWTKIWSFRLNLIANTLVDFT